MTSWHIQSHPNQGTYVGPPHVTTLYGMWGGAVGTRQNNGSRGIIKVLHVLLLMIRGNMTFKILLRKIWTASNKQFYLALIFIFVFHVEPWLTWILCALGHSDIESMQSNVSKCWSCDMRIANWYENCKLIWKLQTHMRIANIHIGAIHQNVRIANWYENCKLIWKLQTDMRIAKQFSRFGL